MPTKLLLLVIDAMNLCLGRMVQTMPITIDNRLLNNIEH